MLPELSAIAAPQRAGSPLPARELADHVLDQFNAALRRLGMYGRDAPHLYAGLLATAFGQDEQLAQIRDTWRAHRTANEYGVAGPVKEIFGAPELGVISSVWAQAGLDLGWLDLDRVLSADAYASARASIAGLCAEDRSRDEIVRRLGEPSLRCGSNPRFAHTWVYAGPGAEDPLICCHFAESPGTPGEFSSDQVLTAQPSLLAVRVGPGPFAGTFTFTPLGRAECTVSP